LGFVQIHNPDQTTSQPFQKDIFKNHKEINVALFEAFLNDDNDALVDILSGNVHARDMLKRSECDKNLKFPNVLMDFLFVDFFKTF